MKKKSLKNKILIPIIGLIVAVMAVSTAITYFIFRSGLQGKHCQHHGA